MVAVILASIVVVRTASAQERGAAYLSFQRWLHAADVAADESVTHEVCGWGPIDLRTPVLAAAIDAGVEATAWDALARRFDAAAWRRRRAEAVLTAHGANAPDRRTAGLHATGGCTDAVRARIERRAAPEDR